jgi:hypothetical protein
MEPPPTFVAHSGDLDSVTTSSGAVQDVRVVNREVGITRRSASGSTRILRVNMTRTMTSEREEFRDIVGSILMDDLMR